MFQIMILPSIMIAAIIGWTAPAYYKKNHTSCPFGFGLNIFEIMLLCANLCSMAVLFLTGFSAALFGNFMQGLTLLIHLIAGGGFFTTLTLMAFFWSEDCRLHLKTRLHTGFKIVFWILLIIGTGLCVTTFVSMTTFFSADTLKLLYHLHQWLALILLGIALGLTFWVIRIRSILSREVLLKGSHAA